MSGKKSLPDDGSGSRDEEADRRKQLADRKAALRWLGTLSVVGWSIAVPILLGILAGRAVDAWLKTGPVFLVLMLLAGIGLGCGAVWRWIKKRMNDGNR
ncbi:MAG TPA: AtpZ/AtpI family protein [Rectinemataceae bacterium]|nr:AtpZ/AtpI family protein [Rectinemataceae bacterium]